MLTRRDLLTSLTLAPLALVPASGFAEEIEQNAIEALDYPDIKALSGFRLFGNKTPDKAQRERAEALIRSMPSGPTALAIAQSFVDRFYLQDPQAISQWPKPAAWNPLIVAFFRSTNHQANNDLTPWCAAFANWCIERAGGKGTQSAASQSFLESKHFGRVAEPQPGDLAIFTCYSLVNQKSLGLGHVGFFKEKLGLDKISVLGGNQSRDGRSSIICEKPYRIGDVSVTRTVGNKRVACTMRLNAYLRLK